MTDIRTLLTEKVALHGERGGFFENNYGGARGVGYAHAIGEARIKLAEFRKFGTKRLLVKAVAWIYLIYESEASRGWKNQPRED